MRTYKLATILLFQADASDKEEDSDSINGPENSHHHQPGRDRGGREEHQQQQESDNEGSCTKQKCKVWFILSQELTAIFCVAFLLLVCLPVLAFWFMFIGILISLYRIFMLIKRLWKDAHYYSARDHYYLNDINDDDISIMDELVGGEGEDVEFQEFLTNFSEEGAEGDNKQ